MEVSHQLPDEVKRTVQIRQQHNQIPVWQTGQHSGVVVGLQTHKQLLWCNAPVCAVTGVKQGTKVHGSIHKNDTSN